ncbi:MAG: hypothetical protein ACM3NQ_09900 [Bacteroidales bacterium]
MRINRQTVRNTASAGAIGVVLVTVSLLPGLSRTTVQAQPHDAGTNARVMTASQVTFRDAMRRLWSDHVFWTREYVIAAVSGTEDAKAAAARLMKNQEDIGAAIAPFYGGQAGTQLTALLKEHIAIAVDVVAAAKAKDDSKLADANRRWRQNATAIADFLSRANANWPRAALVEAMNMHLDTTTREVVDRLRGNYADDVAAFDAVYDHILHMADVLSEGIIKQFPQRFAS